MDRRGFLKLFAAASVGVPVAQHMGLLEHLTSWVLGPKKTIFIPPAVDLMRTASGASLWMSSDITPLAFEHAVQWTKFAVMVSGAKPHGYRYPRWMFGREIPDIKQSSL